VTRSRSSLTHFDGSRRSGRRRYRRRSPLLPFLGFLVVIGLVAGAVWIMYQRFAVTPTAEFRILGLDAEPLPGAMVEGPDGSVETAGDLAAATFEFEPPGQIRVTAEGYYPAVFNVEAVPENGPLYLQLEPRVLNGLVTHSDGSGVVGAAVRIGDREVRTAENGTFEFLAATPGTIEVSKPAWDTVVADWDGSSDRFEVVLEPFMVRGLRVFSTVAADSAEFDRILEMADRSAINALVFDTKEESGAVVHYSEVPEAQEIGAVISTYDARTVLEKAREHGLYTITRIVTFQDGYRAPARPEHAVADATTGDIWRNSSGIGWMDATDRGAWDYPIALAVEACGFGFDEIQFDYVRFPSDGPVDQAVYDVPVDAQVRVETIAAFLAEARDALHELGCAVSADIFGIVMSVPDDQGLGQRVEELSYSVDALSPMIYPSHYSNGWLGLDDPNSHPGTVVAQALAAGIPKLEGGALMRPWIQAFYYDGNQMRQQFDQVDEWGIGYLLWNAVSAFEDDWLPSAGRYPDE
jgi:hypothetical protein